jgi:hypothetical protein
MTLGPSFEETGCHFDGRGRFARSGQEQGGGQFSSPGVLGGIALKTLGKLLDHLGGAARRAGKKCRTTG